jgi:tetratricopeptide (TPR) repeat protein
LTKSREQGLEELTGTSLNLLASLELHEGRFEAARDLFQESVERLESQGESLSRHAAVATDNLGYCHIALDRIELGLPLVHRALSVLDSLGARQAMDYPTLDLCFANVKLTRLDEAESWGIRALGLGKEFGREDVVKNAHYLLAETYSEMGRSREADDQYEALAIYYPDFPALKHYLRQISLMEVINLRA